MIIEALFNVFYGFVSSFFDFLPSIEWTVQASFFTVFLDIIMVAGYILPMGTVTTIFFLSLTLAMFRLIIALIRAIWGLLPIL